VNSTFVAQGEAERFVLRFCGLRPTSRDVVIPCDAAGSVDMDRLSEPLRDRYFFARAVVGFEYRMPMVTPVAE
jgi:hypothetical protein